METTCRPADENLIFKIDVSIHVLILLIFLSAFFVFYISKITEKTINEEIISNIDKGILASTNALKNISKENILKNIPKEKYRINQESLEELAHLEQLGKLENLEKIKQLVIPKYNFIDGLKKNLKNKDKYTEENNNWVKKSILVFNIFAFIIVTLTILILTKQCNTCIDIRDIIKTNLITFVFIAIVEYLFFYNVASKYIPTKPSLFIKSAIERLKNNLK